jgi:hypothetical protein
MPRRATAACQPLSALTISSTAIRSSSMIGGCPSRAVSSSTEESIAPRVSGATKSAAAPVRVSSRMARTRRSTGSPSVKTSTSSLGGSSRPR